MKEEDSTPSKEDFEALIRESLNFVDTDTSSSGFSGVASRGSPSFNREKIILLSGVVLFFVVINITLALSSETIYPLKGGTVSGKGKLISVLLQEEDKALSDVVKNIESQWSNVFSDPFPVENPKYIQKEGGLLMLSE